LTEAVAEKVVAQRLVVRFQRGDDLAFIDLYRRYVDRIYGYMRVGLGDQHEAEDGVQQVFLQAYRALPRYDAGRTEPLEAWLFAIARNQMITMLRRRRRIEPADPARLDLMRERAVEPAPRVGWIDDARLLAAVESLPASQRHVIALRYVLGLSTREIASALERRPHAVRQLHHRALRTLEKRLH
jgi:RNA polymerase sigma-70 factor (ECF subfamily)